MWKEGKNEGNEGRKERNEDSSMKKEGMKREGRIVGKRGRGEGWMDGWKGGIKEMNKLLNIT